MKAAISTGALALALLLSGCGGSDSKDGAGGSGTPVAAVPAPNGGDWTQIVEQTPEGGYRMGNPNAPVKLLEFASISCSHCAEFSEQAGETLRNDYVKSGRVSWEFRPFMIFPTDPGIFMLLGCRGPAPFFQLSEQLFADQANWLGKLQQMPQAQLQQLSSLPPQQQVGALVQATGVDQFFRQRGMQDAEISSCLANQQPLQRLMEGTTRAANEMKVTGTPAFFINGKVVENAGTWATLGPKLKEAVGG